MHNQRIETRSLFRFENFCDRNRIERISRESVNGFRWKRDNFAFTQQFNRALFGGRLAADGEAIAATVSVFTLAAWLTETASDCFLRNVSNFFRIALVRTSQNSGGKKRSVFGARFADSQRPHRNPTRHLRSRKKRIEPLQLRLNRHT